MLRNKPFRKPKYSQYEDGVKLTTGYKPRPLQAMLHARLKRFNVLVCHRRFGKTIFSINEMIDQSLRCSHHNPQYAYVAPTYKQAKNIAWEYLIDYTKNIPGVEINKSELAITIYRPAQGDKIRIMLLGAENPDSLRGIYLDGVILDEYAQCDPSIWGEVVLPTLADRKGWAIFIGTPKGQNHFFEIYQTAKKEDDSWFNVMIKASESNVLSYEELKIQRSAMTDNEYEQEFECSFLAALRGAYYGEIVNAADKDGRIKDVPYNPSFPVDTFWDIGVRDDCTIVFRQKIGETYYYIDYYSNNRQGLPHYIDVLRAKGYRYGRHVWPHDGVQQEFGTGETRIEQARKLGMRVDIQPKQGIGERINASRTRIAVSYFDRRKCDQLLNCLKNYEREYDSKHRIFKDKPLHNWASHGADSFGYSSLDSRDSRLDMMSRNNLPKVSNMGYNEI